ncbi:MAG: hypothetical protein N3E38_00120 [Candidatus Aenigmarchaeota archaeon]|nr:hypothetical protein [Candidatus Aenigmarchaeota archaeon]
MKFKFLIYIVLTFFLTLVSAKEYDSILEIKQPEINVPQCGIATFDFKLTNTGEKEDTFYIVVEGIPEGWYSVSHESIVLKPKESKNVYLFITANCFEEPKNYTGIISFLGNSKTRKEFKMNVIAEHSLVLLLPKNVSACLCEESSFAITLKNNGRYEEDVKLSIVGGNIKEDRVKLKPSESKEIIVYLDKACEASEGKYNLEIIAQSLNSYAKVRKIFTIYRENCYNFKTSYPKEVRACIGEDVKFNIAVNNIGSRDDEYELLIDALNISQRMSIKKDETKIFGLNFSSNEAGIIDLSFSVKGKTKTESGVLRFFVDKCYGVDLQLETNKIDIEIGTGKMIKAKLLNTGSKDDVYKISSDIEWVSIRPQNVSLKSLQSEDVFIYYSPLYGMKGRFDTQIKTESAKAIDIENVTINVYETLPIRPEDEIQNITEIQQNVSTEVKENKIQSFLKNKTLVAVIIGVLVTIMIFGFIYLFVMRE